MSSTTTDHPWTVAWEATTRRIVAHPLFGRLVREVAVAEQTTMPHLRWLQRNSYTYGLWATRGNEPRRTRALDERARDLAARIADDVDFVGWTRRDAEARVYVAARDFVRARKLPGRTP